MKARPLILFDGVCILCNGAVDFIIKRDKQKSFGYLALQSKEGEAFLEKHQLSKDLDTIILYKNEKFYFKSDAILEIVRHLPLWSVVGVLKVLPRPLRDLFYDLVARLRYKIFGKRESCRIIE